MKNWLRPRWYVAVDGGATIFGSADRKTVEELLGDDPNSAPLMYGAFTSDVHAGFDFGNQAVPSEMISEPFVSEAPQRHKVWWRPTRLTRTEYDALWDRYCQRFGRRVVVFEK